MLCFLTVLHYAGPAGVQTRDYGFAELKIASEGGGAKPLLRQTGIPWC